MATYQTLREFIHSPFGSGVPMSDSKLDRILETADLQVSGYTVVEKSYYLHIKIPSSSQQGVYYDVIIRFFPPTNLVEKELTLQNYHIQFFSNSPSFMYKYAVLYRRNGYLIEYLYNKMDPKFFDKLPEKANAKMEISYDKSLYLACKFLASHKFRYLSKIGVLTQKKKSMDRFFADVSSFASMKLDSELRSLENKAKRQIEIKHEKDPEKTTNRKDVMSNNKSNKSITKKTAFKSTSGTQSIKRVTKITATKSTRKT